MAEDDDLITIVDVTDPDDPSYADVKTRRRPLTDAELATLKPTLEKVGAYKFFSMEFNFADGPAVKQFIDSVELGEYKRTKQRKIVQDSMKGTVAGREVVIDSELIEKAFGLVDDGENISKPKGETNGLHAFYIKPKYLHLCQNYRGVYLKLFKSEYSYFVNLTHQIQTYCCGGPTERQITLTQYRAVDLMIRGKPVNWNRYLLQNFQDKLRKYRSGPCALYFGGTLTALIYKALHVDYNLVNKPLLISPQTPDRGLGSDGDMSSRGKKARDRSKERIRDSGPPKKRELARRHVGAVTRSQRILASESLASESLETEIEPPVTRPPGRSSAIRALQARKRKRVRHRVRAASKRQKTASGKHKRGHEVESEPSVMENDATENEVPSSPETIPTSPEATPLIKGGLIKRAAQPERLGDEIVLSSKTRRLSKLYAQATGSPMDSENPNEALALTASKDLWNKYDQFYSVQHEFQLEHIVSKQMLEQSLQRVQELEDALKDKDQKVFELESSKAALEEELNMLKTNHLTYGEDGSEPDPSDQSKAQQPPLKVRLKVGAAFPPGRFIQTQKKAPSLPAEATTETNTKGQAAEATDEQVTNEHMEEEQATKEQMEEEQATKEHIEEEQASKEHVEEEQATKEQHSEEKQATKEQHSEEEQATKEHTEQRATEEQPQAMEEDTIGSEELAAATDEQVASNEQGQNE